MVFEIEEIVSISPMSSTHGVNETTMAFHAIVLQSETDNSPAY